MKRILSFILIFILLSALFVMPASAASASASISVSSSSYYVGNTVSVTVRYASSEAIGSWDFNINYDSSVLQYVSGADAGGGGALRIVGYSPSHDGQTSVSCTIVFKAIGIGNCNISTTPSAIVGWNDMERMSATGAARTVKVVAPPRASTDNVLSELSVAPGELTPAFGGETLSYAVTVPFETTELVVSATPRDSKARVSVSSADLTVGENTVNVTVTAESGATRVYAIQVTRLQSVFADVTASINGVDYTFGYDPSALTPPEGFTVSSSHYGEKEVLAYASPGEGSVKLVWLMTEESGAWYIYNEKDQTFSDYIALSQAEKSYVFLPISQDAEIPEGFMPTVFEKAERKLPVLQNENSAQSGIYLVYALAPDGNIGFYFFDSVSNSFLKFDPSLSAGKEDLESVQAFATLRANFEELQRKADFWEIITLAVAFVAVIFLVVIIILAFIISKRAPVAPLAEQENREGTLPMAEPDEPLAFSEEEEAEQPPKE